MRAKDIILLEDCKPGHLYRIQSRNLSHGIFNLEKKGFIGIRNKFGHEYLATEYHWDTGAPFGTASPLEDLGEVPETIKTDEEIFAWLNEGKYKRLNA